MIKKRVPFFGDITTTSNKYFTFQKFINEDEIFLITNNIHQVKDSLVLIVGDDKAVYLKNWQVRPVMNYYDNLYAFVVKLNRKFFKIYTFKTPFNCVCFDGRVDDFDALVKISKEQDELNMPIKSGWQKNDIIEYRIDRRVDC